jgi:hypothetical protein
MRKFVYENGLSLAFGVIFLLALGGQSIGGWREIIEQQHAHAENAPSYWAFVRSSDYWLPVMENWQSEYLQFALFILLTIWLLQKGSPESKELGNEGRESDKHQKIGRHADSDSPAWARADRLRILVFSNSLLAVMTSIFLATWFAQSVTGWTVYNQDQRDHNQATVAYTGYLTRPDFWERTLQNWQSEFLAVGSMAVLSIYLRQRGSPESKPVGAAHDQTGVEG